MRLLFIAICFIACNNPTSEIKNVDKNSDASDQVQTDAPADSDCSKQYLFRKGTKITNVSYDGNGKELDRSVSEVMEVNTIPEGLSSLVKMSVSSSGTPATMDANYRCDGSNIYFDVKSLFSSLTKGDVKIENAEMSFPLKLQIGQKLKDAGFTMIMNESMKMESKIINREVKALEKIKTDAGSWDCYKITADVEVKMSMLNADEATNKRMNDMGSSMPKTTYSFWMAPDFGIVQMLMYSGDQLKIRSVVSKVE